MACPVSIESHFIQTIRIVVNLEHETVLFFPLKHDLSDFILGMHRNKSFRTGKKPTSLDFLSFFFFFFFFFFDFLFGGRISSFPYDLKALAEVKERKQCMKNRYVPPCFFCFFFFLRSTLESQNVKNLKK